MSDNPLADRGRTLEEDYFRKRDQDLIEKMRRAAAADNARRELSASTGLQDPELIASQTRSFSSSPICGRAMGITSSLPPPR